MTEIRPLRPLGVLKEHDIAAGDGLDRRLCVNNMSSQQNPTEPPDMRRVQLRVVAARGRPLEIAGLRHEAVPQKARGRRAPTVLPLASPTG